MDGSLYFGLRKSKVRRAKNAGFISALLTFQGAASLHKMMEHTLFATMPVLSQRIAIDK